MFTDSEEGDGSESEVDWEDIFAELLNQIHKAIEEFSEEAAKQLEAEYIIGENEVIKQL